MHACRCGHNLLLAHAAAAKTYREQYQAQQQGKIALTTNIVWAEPLTDSTAGACARHVCGLPAMRCSDRVHACAARARRQARRQQ